VSRGANNERGWGEFFGRNLYRFGVVLVIEYCIPFCYPRVFFPFLKQKFSGAFEFIFFVRYHYFGVVENYLCVFVSFLLLL
jgi:hypothetical protein